MKPKLDEIQEKIRKLVPEIDDPHVMITAAEAFTRRKTGIMMKPPIKLEHVLLAVDRHNEYESMVVDSRGDILGGSELHESMCVWNLKKSFGRQSDEVKKYVAEKLDI